MGSFSKYGLVILVLSVAFLSIALTIALVAIYYSGGVAEADGDSVDLDFIFSGIEKVLERANSGILTVYAENAFPVLSGRAVGKTLRPIMGAGRHGQGKFVVYTHSSCFVRPYPIQENDKLFANVASWVAGGKEVNVSAAISAQRANQESFDRIFSAQGILSQTIDPSSQQLENVEHLKLHDFLVLNYIKDVSTNVVEAVRDYVASGGGLILGATPWAPPENEIPANLTFQEAFWGNKILHAIGGIAFAEGHASANTKPGGLFNVSRLFLEDTHAGKVWQDAKEIIRNRQSITKEEYRQIYYILNDRSLYAPKDPLFLQELSDQMAQLHELIPSNEEVTPTITSN